MATFSIFNLSNLYLTPFSSVNNGGELLSEYNQRAALNLGGYKTVSQEYKINSTLYSLEYKSGFTGTRSDDELQMKFIGGRLIITSGFFVINGYFGVLQENLAIDLDDLLNKSELPDSADLPDDYTEDRLVKISLITTASTGNRFDERIIPPAGRVINGLVLTVDSVVDAEGNANVFENELLLGILSMDLDGHYSITDNPSRSRPFTLDRMEGAENADRWIVRPSADEEGVFGISSEGLVNIEDSCWLSFTSPLGNLLRYMVSDPDDAGVAGGTAKPLKQIIGSKASPQDNIILFMNDSTIDGSRGASLKYRTLIGGQSDADAYSDESVPIPPATYEGREAATPTGFNPTRRNSGLLAPMDLYKIDQLWAASVNGTTKVCHEYGPFQTTAEAEDYFSNPDVRQPEPGDFYWVFNDTLTTEGGSSLQNSFGEVSGEVKINVQDRIPISAQDLTIRANASNVDAEVSITGGRIENAEIQDPSIISLKPKGDTFQITAPPVSVSLYNASGAFSGEVSGTVGSGTVSGTLQSDSVQAQSGSFAINECELSETELVGSLTTSSFELSSGVAVNNAKMSMSIDAASGSAEGHGTVSGTISGTVTGKLTRFTQNVSTMYVYTTDGKWVRRAALRGYATPATFDYYGLVRSGDGSTGSVIVDPDTGRMSLNSEDISRLKTSGWQYSDVQEINLGPGSTALISSLEGTWFTKPVTISLKTGVWNAELLPTLSRLRGDITLDVTEATPVVVEGDDTVYPVLKCFDISTLRVVDRKISDLHPRVDIESCQVTEDSLYATNRWVGSQFTSGSATLYPNNAWMKIDNPFGLTVANSIEVRFASITRGEYSIVGGELDIWIKRESWAASETVPENLILVSVSDLKFPPFILKYSEDGSLQRQDIPDNLNLKISGSSGINTTYSISGSSNVESGNLVDTIDWEHGGRLSFNGRLLCSSNQINGLHNVRFRIPVQILNSDDMIESDISYNAIY